MFNNKHKLARQLEIFREEKTETNDRCCKFLNGRLICDTDKLQIRILKEMIDIENANTHRKD